MIIYALKCPKTGAVRYVGITKQTIKERFRQHLKSARAGINLPVCAWIRSLDSEGKIPEVAIVEHTDDVLRESIWIEHYGGTKKLLNMLDAKDACPAKNKYVAQRIGDSLRGRTLSPEHRAKISAALTGRSLPEDVKRKLRGRTFNLSEETKVKMRKPKSEEHRINAMKALQAIRDSGRYNKATGARNGLVLHPESALKGSKNPNAKINEEVVLKIRAENKSGESTVSLAAKYNISQASAWRICKNLSWRHV